MPSAEALINVKTRGTKAASKELRFLTGTLKSLVGVIGLREAVRGTLRLSELAGQADGARESFERLSKAMGRDASQDLLAMQQATQGVASELDLLRTGVEALNNGLDFGDMITAMEYTYRFTQSTGKQFGEYWRRVMTGLVRGSALFLDDVGINVMGASDVVAAAIEQMQQKMGNLGASSDNAALALQRIKTAGQNELLDLGREINEALGLRQALVGVADALEDIGKSDLELTAESLEEMGRDASKLRDQLERLNAADEERRLRAKLQEFITPRGEQLSRFGGAAQKQAPATRTTAFEQELKTLAKLGDAERVRLAIQYRTANATADNARAYANQVDRLRELLSILEGIEKAQNDKLGILLPNSPGIDPSLAREIESARLAELARSSGGPQAKLPSLGLEENADDQTLQLFEADLRRVNATIEVGKKGLPDLLALLKRWELQLLSVGEEGYVTLLEAQADYNSRAAREADRASTQRRNQILADAEEILSAEEGTYQERLTQASAFLQTALAGEKLLADDVEAIQDRIAEYNRELGQQQAEQARFAAQTLERVFGSALDEIVRGFLDGELSAKRFFRTLLSQIATTVLQLGVLNALINALVPGAGLPTLGKLFGAFGGQAVPGAAAGAFIPATPGGQLVNVGEGGVPELITPLPTLEGLFQRYALPAPLEPQVVVNVGIRGTLESQRFYTDVIKREEARLARRS